MYDFHKAEIINTPPTELSKNKLLEFIIDCNMQTGELKEHIREAKFNQLEFNIFCNKFINLSGSFHKYHNSANHNHNDYALSDFYRTLIDLDKKFNINPFNALLHNLEVGVNIKLPFETKVFLNSILSFKGKEYELDTFRGRGYMLRFVFDQYELKIYDKGLQYQLKDNVLRFEIKVRKMYYLESKGVFIFNYPDLLDARNIERLKQILLKSFDSLLVFDNTINLNKIKNKKERDILTNGSNPKFWVNLKSNNKNTYKKKRDHFKKLVSKYSDTKQTVRNILYSKLDAVTTIDSNLEKKVKELLIQKGFKTVPDLTESKTSAIQFNGTQYNSSSIWLNQYLFTKHRIFGRVEVLL